MRDVVREFLKAVVASHAGRLLPVLNLCLIAYEYGRSPAVPHESGDCFVVGEVSARGTPLPAWLVLGKAVNVPALILTGQMAVPLELMFPDMCVNTAGRVNAAVLALVGSVQWAAVGYGVKGYFSALREVGRRT